jgi:tetraacyldisaccharide 4'-kinase
MNPPLRQGTLERGVRRYWKGDAGPLAAPLLTAVTAPLAALFGVAVRLRNRAFDTGLLRSRTVPVPVISVGNLSVGGTGKTPVAGWIVDRLVARGCTPAVVSRGYGEDEIALHRRWHPQVVLTANPDRVAAALEAVDQGADVVVLDDGFQHRALARDADIVLVSAHDPFPPRLLPRGPWREPLGSLQRASLVLVTGKGDEGVRSGEDLLMVLHDLPQHPPLGRVGILASRWTTLGGESAQPPEPGEEVLVVASIAHPQELERMLREAGLGGGPEGPSLALLAYPDHHAYSEAQVGRILERAGGRRIVTTEKDAVKLAAFAPLVEAVPAPRVLTLRVDPAPGVDRLLDRLLDRALARGGDRAGGRA